MKKQFQEAIPGFELALAFGIKKRKKIFGQISAEFSILKFFQN